MAIQGNTAVSKAAVNSKMTRLSVNFFVPPAEHDADVKLYMAAKKWMTKVLECDNVSILP